MTDDDIKTDLKKKLRLWALIGNISYFNRISGLLEVKICKRSRIQHVDRMPRNKLPRVMKRYSPIGRRNHGRPLKTLLDT